VGQFPTDISVAVAAHAFRGQSVIRIPAGEHSCAGNWKRGAAMSLAVLAPKSCSETGPSKPRAKSLKISQPGDALEREADRVAAKVSRGDRIASWSLSKLSESHVQRQDSGALVKDERPKPQSEEYKEAASKLGDAFLKTDLGKKLENAAKQAGDEFISSLPGKVIAGAAASGAVAALAATHTPLPVQLPEIPLDKLSPGLKVKLTYEGPVDHPTKALITFSYTPGAVKKKSPLTETERYRAETARIAAEQAKFRAGLKYIPGSPQDLQQKAEEKAMQDYLTHRYGTLPGFGDKPLVPTLPGGGTPATGLQLPKFESPFKAKPPTLLNQKIELKPLSSATLELGAEKKEEPAPVQRKAADAAPAHVSADVLPRSAGRPLDSGTRAFMESTFGFDFSKVRVHTDASASASAKAINALAYTVGNDLVFAAGQYSPHTAEGKKLLAHELAHTIQQNGVAPVRALQRKCACGGSGGEHGECEECKKELLVQRQAASPGGITGTESFDGCDKSMQQDLQAKHGPALAHVDRAIQSLAKGWRQMAPADKASFSKFFDPAGSGEIDEGFANEVRSNFLRIRRYMSSLSFDCDPNSKTLCGSGQRWCVGGRVMWTCFGALHVCPKAYATADESFKMETMIHESVHNALHTTDREYSTSKNFKRLKPRGSGFLAFLSKIPIIGAIFRLFRSNNDTLYNPDSYAGFAMEV
jgi:hypothetical protein